MRLELEIHDLGGSYQLRIYRLDRLATAGLGGRDRRLVAERLVDVTTETSFELYSTISKTIGLELRHERTGDLDSTPRRPR